MMRRDDGRRRLTAMLSLGLALSMGVPGDLVRAAPPVVSMTPAGVKIQITSSTLTEVLDALSKSAGFKLTYEGSRPTAPLYNIEIESPTVGQAVMRLLEGQNLNYAMILDVSGRNVATLLMMGAAKGGPGSSASGAPRDGARAQPFATPRVPRNDMPPVDDDPQEMAEEPPPPEPTPTPAPAPTPNPRGPAPFPQSPFGRPPFGPRSPPPPSPSPSA
jgi:hypothetical protein